ncbi:recombination regulator RecX [Streptosporangium sp. NPDC001681]|uniref:recombination regulator RecX n=1 Tax=Streptosporangium sp. NPDC001681 TaxID=3154395 RepID=UPI00332490D4
MMMGADLGPPGEAGPRDWGAWPDEPRIGSPGRSGRGRGDGLPASEGEAAGPAGGEPRSRKGRGSRRGGRRSGGGSPGALPDGPLPDGPVEESPARKGAGADPQAVARAICLRLLTMAPRTRAQLAEALRKREVPQEAADAVLERFSEVGLIDDEAFAAAWVSSRHAGRGLARKALASELRHRGVDEETVKDAMEQLDPEQEAETARGLVRRKLSSTRGLDPAVRTRRLAGMLARKGYGPGLAFRVIREVLEDDEAETAPFTEDSGYPLD